jgi:transcriptional regulator with XRE-family HTH domain
VTEIRRARIGAGLSQERVAQRTGVSRSRVSRIEQGRQPQVSAELLIRLADVVGLDLVVRAYPGRDPTLDAGQRRLLRRLADRLGPGWEWQFEVPLPILADRRAWDAVATRRSTGLRIHVEAETRLDDAVQALLRRIALKHRDTPDARVLLVVADTRHDREIVRAAGAELAAMFPGDPRQALARLAMGVDPGADVLVLV